MLVENLTLLLYSEGVLKYSTRTRVLLDYRFLVPVLDGLKYTSILWF